MATAVKCTTCGTRLQLKEMPQSGKFKCPKCGAVSPTDPSSLQDGLIGRTIGGHKIQAILYKGAGKTVYKATQISMRRSVAVKVLPPEKADPQGAEAFFARAKDAAKLSHPGIVSIYDMGTEEDVSYFSMEYVEGSTIAGLIEERGLPPVRDAVKIAMEAGKALSYAVQAGIVNFKLSAQSVMLTDSGAVKLISSFICDAQRPGPRPVAALGALLYYILTGRNATPGKRFKPVDQFNPKVSPLIQSIVNRMLSTDLNESFATLDQAIEAIEKSLRARPSRRLSRPAGRTGRRGKASRRASGESPRHAPRRSSARYSDEPDEEEAWPHFKHRQTDPVIPLVIAGICLVVAVAAGITVYFSTSSSSRSSTVEKADFTTIKQLLETGRDELALTKCKEFKDAYPNSVYIPAIDKVLPNLEKNVERQSKLRVINGEIAPVLGAIRDNPGAIDEHFETLDAIQEKYSHVPDIKTIIANAKAGARRGWRERLKQAGTRVAAYLEAGKHKQAFDEAEKLKAEFVGNTDALAKINKQIENIRTKAKDEFATVEQSAAELVKNKNYKEAIKLYQDIVDQSIEEYAEKARQKIAEIEKKI